MRVGFALCLLLQPLGLNAEILVRPALTEPGGGLGAILLSEGFPPPTATGVLLFHDRQGRLVPNGDTVATGPVYGPLRDLTLFGGTQADAVAGTYGLDPGDRVPFTWTSQYVDPDQYVYVDQLFHLRGVERLAFTAVTATIDPYIHFGGAAPVMELRNADVHFANDLYVDTAPGGSFAILAAAGENRISELDLQLGQVDLTIQVAPGATLWFDQIGDLRSTARADTLSQHPGMQSLLTVDGGELGFRYANVMFDHGQTVITNGGRLTLAGTGTRVVLDRISLRDGTISLGNGSPGLVATLLAFEAAGPGAIRELRFVGTATADIGEVRFFADGVIIGEEVLPNTQLSAQIMALEPGVSAQMTGHHRIETGILLLDAGSVLQVDGGSRFHFGTLTGPGTGSPTPATINIGALGSVWQDGNFQGDYRIALNIEADGRYNVAEGQVLAIHDAGMTVDIAHGGILFSKGVLTASGTLTGDGTVSVDPFSTLSIGMSRHIASVHMQPELRLETLSRLQIDLGIQGGTEVHDTLYYDDNPVRLSNSVQYVLFNPLGNTADDFDNRQFTIIQSEDAGSLGGISYAPGLANIILDPSMPAGLVVTVVDLQTNGHADLTIETDLDLQVIAHHAGTRNHRDFVQAMVDGATSSPAATLTGGQSLGTALGSLSIGDIHSLSGAHLEGYASAQTIAVQRQDLLSDVLLSNLSSRCEAGRSRWIDAIAGRGSVNARDDLDGFSYGLTQVAMGQEFGCSASGGYGFYLGFGTSRTDAHDAVQHDITARSVSLGLYGMRDLGHDWRLSGMIGFGLGRERSERIAPSVGAFTGGTALAELTTHHAQIAARIERAFALGQSGLTLTPSLSLLYAQTRMEGSRETGAADFNFQLKPITTHALVIEPALAVTRNTQTRGGKPYSMTATFKASYDFAADRKAEHKIKASNPLFGGVDQVGLNRGALGYELGLSGEIALTANTSLTGDLRVGRHSGGLEQAIGFALTSRW